MVENLKAKDIMTQNYKWVNEQDNLAKALSLFDEDTDVLIVLDKNKRYSGILTERAIIRSGLDRKTTKVVRLKMFAPKVKADTPLTECARLMIENDIMNLPVFRGNTLLGVIDDTKLLKEVTMRKFGERKAGEFMSTEVLVAAPEDSIATVLRSFREFHISRMPIVEDGNLVGIVTLHDIMEKVLNAKERPSFGHIIDEKESVLELPVENVMSFPVYTCTPETPVREVVKLMVEWGLNSVVVVDNKGSVLGIITRRDLLEPISELPKVTEYPIIQISSKIEAMNRSGIKKLVTRFVDKFKGRLPNPSFYIYLTQHKEKLRGMPLIYARLRVSSGNGKYHVRAEGWGSENAVRNALLKLEKEILKRTTKLTRADKQRLLEYVEFESLS
ncbi:CBS domain-containing protein [Candidatus Woesearchaeota archaeon]|nr:CBS domain-containing protein [Candidatus Woesearchaeota archaeon]